MNDCEDYETRSRFWEVRAELKAKGWLTIVDLFRMYRAQVEDVDELEADLAHIVENRPGVDVNPDVSLERARLEGCKPPGYDEWLKREAEGG